MSPFQKIQLPESLDSFGSCSGRLGKGNGHATGTPRGHREAPCVAGALIRFTSFGDQARLIANVVNLAAGESAFAALSVNIGTV